MGSPKQLLAYGGTTLVARATRAACESRCSPVYVVLGFREAAVGSVLDVFDVRKVSNPSWQDGLASSIRVGVEAALSEGPRSGLLLSLADQPHVTSEILDALLDRFDEQPSSIVASGYDGGVGVPALFGADYFSALAGLAGDRGARPLLEQHRARLQVVVFEAGAVDIDTPEDYASLCSKREAP